MVVSSENVRCLIEWLVAVLLFESKESEDCTALKNCTGCCMCWPEVQQKFEKSRWFDRCAGWCCVMTCMKNRNKSKNIRQETWRALREQCELVHPSTIRSCLRSPSQPPFRTMQRLGILQNLSLLSGHFTTRLFTTVHEPELNLGIIKNLFSSLWNATKTIVPLLEEMLYTLPQCYYYAGIDKWIREVGRFPDALHLFRPSRASPCRCHIWKDEWRSMAG